jgi:hypothetical protein
VLKTRFATPIALNLIVTLTQVDDVLAPLIEKLMLVFRGEIFEACDHVE